MSDDKLQWKHLWYAARPDGYSVEDLYQAFKARLMAELVAERPSEDYRYHPERFPLVSKENSK